MANTEDTLYDKVPLNDLVQPVRLLRRISASEALPIRCILHRFALGQAGAFTALSYTWGSPAPLLPIIVNDVRVFVRQNLHEFLRCESFASAGPWYWIDALCIDQSNLEERSQQVQMMGDIYRQAHCVRIWLGLDANDSEIAMQALDRLEGARLRTAIMWRTKLGLALIALLNRSYWRRVWIIQEMLLAKAMTLTCGYQAIQPERFQNLCEILPLWRHDFFVTSGLESKAETQMPRYPALELFDRKSSLRDAGYNNTANAVANLVWTFRDMEATDTRDKIYALLGLAKSMSRSNKSHSTHKDDIEVLVPDYSKDLETLFIEFVAFVYPRWSFMRVDFENVVKTLGKAFELDTPATLQKGIKLGLLLDQQPFNDFGP